MKAEVTITGHYPDTERNRGNRSVLTSAAAMCQSSNCIQHVPSCGGAAAPTLLWIALVMGANRTTDKANLLPRGEKHATTGD